MRSLFFTLCMVGLLVPWSLHAADAKGGVKVKIYGKAALSTDYLDNGKDDGMIYVANNSSRLGFKGWIPAGQGLKAIFQYEVNAQTVDDKAKYLSFEPRNSFIGLNSTSMGTVLIGRHDTPFKKLSRKTDMFSERIGDSRNVVKGSGWDSRLANMIAYVSPKFTDTTVKLAYVAEDGSDGISAASSSVVYKTKDIWVGAGYEIHSTALSGTGGEKESAFRIGGSYKMDDIKVSALFHSATNEDGQEDRDRIAYGLGGMYKVGKTAFKAQIYMAQERDDGEDDGSVWALGVEQKLAKKVTAYFDIAGSTNGDKGKFTVTGKGGHNTAKDFVGAKGESSLGVSIGGIILF